MSKNTVGKVNDRKIFIAGLRTLSAQSLQEVGGGRGGSHGGTHYLTYTISDTVISGY